MPIERSNLLSTGQQTSALQQILNGQTVVLSDVLNRSVQAARDSANLQAGQERNFLSERARLDAAEDRDEEQARDQFNRDRRFGFDVTRDARNFSEGARRFDLSREDVAADRSLRARGINISERQGDRRLDIAAAGSARAERRLDLDISAEKRRQAEQDRQLPTRVELDEQAIKRGRQQLELGALQLADANADAAARQQAQEIAKQISEARSHEERVAIYTSRVLGNTSFNATAVRSFERLLGIGDDSPDGDGILPNRRDFRAENDATFNTPEEALRTAKSIKAKAGISLDAAQREALRATPEGKEREAALDNLTNNFGAFARRFNDPETFRDALRRTHQIDLSKEDAEDLWRAETFIKRKDPVSNF